MAQRLRHLIVGPLVGLGVSVAYAQAPDFARDVLPIFEASCLHCHGPEVQEHQLRLDSVEAILRGGRSGHAVLPGDSESSLVVRHLAGLADPMMPLDAGPLTAEQIAIVRHWIDDGDLTLGAGRPAENDRHWPTSSLSAPRCHPSRWPAGARTRSTGSSWPVSNGRGSDRLRRLPAKR